MLRYMNKRLKLNTFEKLSHYWPATMFAGLMLWSIYLMLSTADRNKLPRACYIFCFCASLSAIFYIIQKRRLQYIAVKTTLTPTEVSKIVHFFEQNKGWKRKRKTSDIYIATIDGGILKGSWGERITIEQHKDTLYISSICDPEKPSSLTSWGRNKKHINAFKHQVALHEKAKAAQQI